VIFVLLDIIGKMHSAGENNIPWRKVLEIMVYLPALLDKEFNLYWVLLNMNHTVLWEAG
jgi:hypothetical protein